MKPSKFKSPGGLFVVITLVNLGNYLLNLVLGRFMGPEIFAEAGILATLVLVLSFIAVGIQLTMAKYTAQIKAESGSVEAAALLKWGMRKALISGFLLAGVLITLAGPLRSFLQFDRLAALIIAATGIPFYFLLSVQRGYLQGIQRFGPFATSYIVEMVARVLVTLVLVRLFAHTGSQWMAEAVALGFLAAFASGCLVSVPDISGEHIARSSIIPVKRAVWRFLTLMMAYECTQILISYGDAILVKHYHDDQTAGLYTALSLIGRIVYFGTWAVVMLLIPKVVKIRAEGGKHRALFNRYFLFVCGIGALITTGCALFPGLVVQVLFGKAYLAISAVLWKYALATTMFAAANVFAYYYMATDRYLPVLLTAIAGITQLGLIASRHDSIEYIIHVQVVMMSILLGGMSLFHLLNISSYEKTEISHRYALSTK